MARPRQKTERAETVRQPRRRPRKNRRNRPRRPLLAVLGPALRTAGALAVLIGVNIGCFLAYNGLCGWDLFGADTVAVTGNRRLTAPDVRKQAGISVGDNILAVNLSQARRRLLAHPWVEEASVYREIPDRIRIHVLERECLAVVDLGRRFLIDTHGVLFSTAPQGETPGIPLIRGLEVTDLDMGDGPSSAALEAALEVLRLVASGTSPIRPAQLSEVQVDHDAGLTLKLHADPHRMPFEGVFLGFGDYGRKLDQLADLPSRLRRIGLPTACRWVSLENRSRTIVQPSAAEAS